MAVKIGHAVMDEDGGITGLETGDQLQGKKTEEVGISAWYAQNSKGVGWVYYLECTDPAIREGLAAFIEAACANSGIGYSQPNRWGLYKAIKAGESVETAQGDCDCTSLIITGLIAAGLGIKATGYSGNMYRILMATGMFTAYTDTDHLTSDRYAKRGGIYLRSGHALTVLENGSGAGSDEDYASEADQIDPPYVQITGSVNVRKTASKDAKIIYTAKNEKLPFGEYDDDTGWYGVDSPAGPGFVSCNIPRWAKLVTE